MEIINFSTIDCGLFDARLTSLALFAVKLIDVFCRRLFDCYSCNFLFTLGFNLDEDFHLLNEEQFQGEINLDDTSLQALEEKECIKRVCSYLFLFFF
jgi:hypothetical protein